MKLEDISPVPSGFAAGLKPFLALEITETQAPKAFEGEELVDAVLALVQRLRPVRVFLLGDEPLVRGREIGRLLPELERLGIEVQLVTGACLPIPQEYRIWDNLQVVVSVDGFRPEHDENRLPASYYRVLRNISGHTVVAHCLIESRSTSPLSRLREFTRFWSQRDEVCGIYFSLSGACSPAERYVIAEELESIRHDYPKVYLPNGLLEPPRCPEECVFARMTAGVAADLFTPMAPCPVSHTPLCSCCAAGHASGGGSRMPKFGICLGI